MNLRDRISLPGDGAASVDLHRPRGGLHPRTANDVRETDSDYYQRRTIQEQLAAQKAVCPEARAVHQMLAEMYRRRAMISATDPPCRESPSVHYAISEVA